MTSLLPQHSPLPRGPWLIDSWWFNTMFAVRVVFTLNMRSCLFRHCCQSHPHGDQTGWPNVLNVCLPFWEIVAFKSMFLWSSQVLDIIRDWLAQCQDNVSEWETCDGVAGMVSQWISTIKVVMCVHYHESVPVLIWHFVLHGCETPTTNRSNGYIEIYTSLQNGEGCDTKCNVCVFLNVWQNYMTQHISEYPCINPQSASWVCVKSRDPAWLWRSHTIAPVVGVLRIHVPLLRYENQKWNASKYQQENSQIIAENILNNTRKHSK